MAMRFQCTECDAVWKTDHPAEALCPTDPEHDSFIFLGEVPSDLTEMEMAYFDDIRNTNNKVSLVRMTLDGNDVAVIAHEVTGTGIPEAFMPLALLLDEDTLMRLRSVNGGGYVAISSEDVIGQTHETSDEVPDNLENL